jgi:hypothetical protein
MESVASAAKYSNGNVIFEGRYYDARVTQVLAGGDARPSGQGDGQIE